MIQITKAEDRFHLESDWLSAYWLFGGLLLLLVIALGYRILRARVRRSESVSRRKPGPTDPLP